MNFDKMQYVDHNVNLTLVSVNIYFIKKTTLCLYCYYRVN